MMNRSNVKEIRKMHNNNISNNEIYKKYPQVSTTSIRNIINNKTWREEKDNLT